MQGEHEMRIRKPHCSNSCYIKKQIEPFAFTLQILISLHGLWRKMSFKHNEEVLSYTLLLSFNYLFTVLNLNH